MTNILIALNENKYLDSIEDYFIEKDYGIILLRNLDRIKKFYNDPLDNYNVGVIHEDVEGNPLDGGTLRINCLGLVKRLKDVNPDKKLIVVSTRENIYDPNDAKIFPHMLNDASSKELIKLIESYL